MVWIRGGGLPQRWELSITREMECSGKAGTASQSPAQHQRGSPLRVDYWEDELNQHMQSVRHTVCTQ